ncbi:hypothetical protein FKM82_005825 [Ascaphus truei]
MMHLTSSMLARRATHCKKGGDTKHSYTHRVAVEQLLTCYSSNKTSNTRETDCRHVPAQNHSSPVTLRSSSASRLSEQRLRPRTCTACRSCMNPAPRSSVHSAATSTSLPPLDQPKHLPYYPGKANESRPKVRHKNRAAGKPLETQSCSLAVLPARTPSELALRSTRPVSLPRSTHFSDTELRKWIIQFGGNEQAAYMARGLQKLQLAYEQGKAEMSQQTENKTMLPIEH